MISKHRDSGGTTVATLETDAQAALRIAALVDEGLCGDGLAIELVDQGAGTWRVTLHARARADQREIRDLIAAALTPMAAAGLRFEPVAAKDWIGASLAGLRPVRAGRFVVHGGHDRAAIAPNRIGIEIEAALAFGTGHHGTTRGCLLALDALCKRLASPSPCREEGFGARKEISILDLGTGSGVLAIAAARALRQPVLATDVDAAAVRVARGNVRHNGAGPLVGVVHADGVARAAIRARAPFDLVCANILLRPLQRFAAPLTRLLAPGGRIVLSGLLAAQANAAIAAYHALALERRITLDGWTTLVLARRIRPRRAVAGRGRDS